MESPVHDNWKKAIVEAAETDTVFLNRRFSPGLRALRTENSESLEYADHNIMRDFAGDPKRIMDLYFGGDLNASIALTGQVAGRIDGVIPVADIIRGTANEFFATLEHMVASYLEAPSQG